MVNLKGFTHKINESSLGKNVSNSTIKRILKRFGFTWKRVRKSLKKLQDPILFAFFKQEIKELIALEKAGELDVFAFDESYIGLNPNSVYAWQSKESPYVLPAIRGESLSMAGFLKKDNTFQGYTINGACNTETFIAIMEDFMKTVTKKTVIIIDNASFHKATEVLKKIPFWKQNKIFLQFIPAYCSELNWIETLWHHIKHLWLDVHEYDSIKELKIAIDNIFKNIGKELYQINFK